MKIQTQRRPANYLRNVPVLFPGGLPAQTSKHRRRVVALAMPLICVMFLSVASRCNAAAVSFSDNFTPGASSLWNNYSGNWDTSGGAYFAHSPAPIPAGGGGSGAETALPFDLVDFTVRVNANNIGDGGLFLRGNGTNQNGVLLVLGGNGYGQGARGGVAGSGIYWHVVQGGAAGGEFGFAANAFAPGSNHLITVTVAGNVYSAYIDGASTPVTTLVNNTFTHGTVGLYDDQPGSGGSGAVMSFSNFSVNGATLPEPGMIIPAGVACAGFLASRRRRSAPMLRSN